MFLAIAKTIQKIGDAPGKILLFAEGEGRLADGRTYLVDRQAFDLVVAGIRERGIDLVFDYEHQTLKDVKAPAAGWIRGADALEYVPGQGIVAAVDWTEEAAGYIERGEYRYFSPVFNVRESDGRLATIRNAALTNSPLTNNLQPILAKLGSQPTTESKESNMDFIAKLLAKLGLKDGAGEEETLAAVDTIIAKAEAKDDHPVVAKEIITALGLTDAESDVSTVVASIHAAKQTGAAGAVSKADFDALKKELAEEKATQVVAKAMAAGKITPDQKDWATAYAKSDLAGFETYVAKAPQVVPVDQLPGKTTTPTDPGLGDVDMDIAAKLGVTADDIKTHGGITVG